MLAKVTITSPAFVSAQPVNLRGGFHVSTSTICTRSSQPRFAKSVGRSRVHNPTPIVMSVVPIEIDEASFDTEVLSSDTPVLVDFYADWCGPCKLMSPLMDWAAMEYEGKLKVVKLDTEVATGIVKKYDLHGLPTFAVFRDGEAYGIKEGAMGKGELNEYIIKHAAF